MITALPTGRGTWRYPAPDRWDVVALRLSISGMGCSRCADRIRHQLLSRPGVLSARICHETGRASVAFDPAELDAAEVISMITAAGDDRHGYEAAALFSIGLAVENGAGASLRISGSARR